MKNLNIISILLSLSSIFVTICTTKAQEYKVQIGVQLGNYYSDLNETNLSFGHNLAFNVDYF